MPWPPSLDDLKAELKSPDTRDDAGLDSALAAAIAYVEGPQGRGGDFNFLGTPGSLLPYPDADIERGTLHLAIRYYARRNSPDGLIDAGEFGSVRIPTSDVDLERQLGVGRFRLPMIR